MKYLLIDFGATYIKCAVYHGELITPTTNYPSPFATAMQITKSELYMILANLIKDHQDVNGVIICTILGGKWEENIYKSWKCVKPGDKGPNCMISGLLNSTVVHSDHAEFTTAPHYVDGLRLAGCLNNMPIYCALGDTHCVIRSLNIPEDGVVINMGTGSQVISNKEIIRYYPAGRSFLVFDRLFEFSSISIFDVIKNLTIEDIKQSSLMIDLAVFEQAQGWSGGGLIGGINEDNFNITNLVASLIKAFVNQYREGIVDAKTVLLVGGISNKISILPEVFKLYYPDKTIIHKKDIVEATHRGLAYMINKHIK